MLLICYILMKILHLKLLNKNYNNGIIKIIILLYLHKEIYKIIK